MPPKSPKSKINESNLGNLNGDKDIEGNVNTDSKVPEEILVEVEQGRKTKGDSKAMSIAGVMKATMAFPRMKSKSNLEEDKIIPMDKINEDFDEPERSQNN